MKLVVACLILPGESNLYNLIHDNTFVCCWESYGKLSHLERHEVSVGLAGGLSVHMM